MRSVRGGAEVAFVEGSGNRRGETNAVSVLQAWEAVGRSFSRFQVNSLGHAWAERAGGRMFVADVEGGFSWPKEER